MSEQNMPEHEISEFDAQIIEDQKEFGEYEDKVLKVIGRDVGCRHKLQFCIGDNMLDVFARLDVSPQGIAPVLEWKKSYRILDTKGDVAASEAPRLSDDDVEALINVLENYGKLFKEYRKLYDEKEPNALFPPVMINQGLPKLVDKLKKMWSVGTVRITK